WDFASEPVRDSGAPRRRRQALPSRPEPPTGRWNAGGMSSAFQVEVEEYAERGIGPVRGKRWERARLGDGSERGTVVEAAARALLDPGRRDGAVPPDLDVDARLLGGLAGAILRLPVFLDLLEHLPQVPRVGKIGHVERERALPGDRPRHLAERRGRRPRDRLGRHLAAPVRWRGQRRKVALAH